MTLDEFRERLRDPDPTVRAEPCALLGRSEPRDVEDIHVLLQNGGR